MPVNDNALEPRDELISAAHAAASWVRARRSTWARATPPVAGEQVDPIAAIESSVPAASVPIVAAASFPLSNSGAPPPAMTPRVRILTAQVLRWLARGALAAALLAGAILGGRQLWHALPPAPALPARTLRTAPAPVSAGRAKPAGALHVKSTPPGATVVVDGKTRGVTPLDVTGLSPGRHEVALQSTSGSVQRTVTVSANTTVTIDEAIFSGFVTVYAPFDVTVSEAARVLRADDRQQIMLPPGTHELRLTNRALGYDVVRRVDIKPGESTNLQLTASPSALTVTASEPADVWLDGTRLGGVPLNAAPVDLGVHEIVVKRAGGGERRFTVTIGVKPFTLVVNF